MAFSYCATAISRSTLVTFRPDQVRDIQKRQDYLRRGNSRQKSGLKETHQIATGSSCSSCQGNAGEKCRPGGADVGIGGFQGAFGLQNIRPVQQDFRRGAGGDVPKNPATAVSSFGNRLAGTGEPVRGRLRAFSSCAMSPVYLAMSPRRYPPAFGPGAHPVPGPDLLQNANG